MVVVSKVGGWSGLRVFPNHKIIVWGELFNIIISKSRDEAKMVEENSATGMLHEVLQEGLYCYMTPCFST